MATIFSAQSAKAFTAALLAGLSALGVVVAGDGSASLDSLTLAQWVTIAIAVVGTWAATYNIPNATPPVAPAPVAPAVPVVVVPSEPVA